MNLLSQFQYHPDPKVLVADNDSTIMKGEIIDTLAEIVGGTEEIAILTNAQMNGRSLISFAKSLDQRVAILVKHGLQKQHFAECASRMEFSDGFVSGLCSFLKQNKSLRGRVFILSGGFFEIIAQKIEMLPIPFVEKEILRQQIYANFFECRGEKVIGVNKNISRMRTENAKKRMVKQLIKHGDIAVKTQILGLGDGANDIGMIPPERGINVAFVGNISRPNTVAKSDAVVKNFHEVFALLNKEEKMFDF